MLYKVLHVLKMPKVKGRKRFVLGAESCGITRMIECLEQKKCPVG